MEKGVISSNVRRLRAFKNMSQGKVAENAGISLQAYRNIENGRSIPRVDTLQKVANTFGVGIHELVVPVRSLTQVRFRALKKMTAREQIVVEVGSWLEKFDALEELLGDHVRYNFSDLAAILERDCETPCDPVEVAKRARAALGLGAKEPIFDICGLLESAGIKVFPYSFTNDSFFGLSVGPDDGGPAIVVNVNKRMPVERWIFSAAHELGHLLLHLGSFDVKQAAEDNVEEKEADVFASHFLVPNARFESEWRDTYGHGFVERVIKVKRIFRVSYATVLYRLIELGHVDRSIWMKFAVQYKRITGRALSRKEEPSPVGAEDFASSSSADEIAKLAKEDFVPDRLYRLVRLAVQREEITMSRAAQILRIELPQMLDLANAWVVDE